MHVIPDIPPPPLVFSLAECPPPKLVIRSRSITGPMAGGNVLWMVIVEPSGRLDLQGEFLVGRQVLAERPGRAEIGQVDRDLKLFAGFQEVVAVVGADG